MAGKYSPAALFPIFFSRCYARGSLSALLLDPITTSLLLASYRARYTQLLNLPQATDPGMLGFEMPEMRPPEEVLGLTTTPSYDTFQLGLLVWWMATGTPLFDPQPMTLNSILREGGGGAAGSPAAAAAAGGGQQDNLRPAGGGSSGKAYDLNEMHLAKMMTVLGRPPLEVCLGPGRRSKVAMLCEV